MQTFGYVQSKLFPFYFLIGAVTGLTMLFVAIYSSRNIAELSSQQKSVVSYIPSLTGGIEIA